MRWTLMRQVFLPFGTAALLCSSTFSLTVHAQRVPVTGSIAGKVYEKTSRTSLSNVQISAKHITTNAVFMSGLTDGRGSYLIPEVPAGIYAFSLQYSGRDYPLTEKLDARLPMSFLLETCFLLDFSNQTASVLQECSSELYAETQVVAIGPHRFFRTPGPLQDELALPQTELAVQHTALDCLANDMFPKITAQIQPAENVQSSRVYFRAEQYPDFYYVEMEGTGDVYTAVLPKPSPDTQRVIYYIEAVDSNFNNAQTPEASTEVSDSETCSKKNPAAAYYEGESPDIMVGAVTAGVPAVPLGFQASGITGFISATGVVTSVGAGAAAAGGAAGAVGAAAAGAGAAGAGLGAAGTVIIVSGAAAAGAGVATSSGNRQDEASGVQKE